MQGETVKINFDDDSLVKQCKRGDTVAMERLILKYQHRVYNVIYKICANRSDAEELTQETFVKVLENIEKFEQRSKFYTWMFRIAVNLTLSYCKRKVKLGMKSLEIGEENEGSDSRTELRQILCDEKSPDPAEVAQKKEMCELVVKAMMRLEDDHRAVLVLRDIEGLSYSSIAGIIGIELGTVKSRISRARSNLKDILEAI